LDNVLTPLLEDTYHRLSSNYAYMAQFIYESQVDSTISTAQILKLIKRNPDDDTGTKTEVQIPSLRHLLKFKRAVPLLIRLFNAGGIWVTTESEKAFAVLVKCKIEDVGKFYF